MKSAICPDLTELPLRILQNVQIPSTHTLTIFHPEKWRLHMLKALIRSALPVGRLRPAADKHQRLGWMGFQAYKKAIDRREKTRTATASLPSQPVFLQDLDQRQVSKKFRNGHCGRNHRPRACYRRSK